MAAANHGLTEETEDLANCGLDYLIQLYTT